MARRISVTQVNGTGSPAAAVDPGVAKGMDDDEKRHLKEAAEIIARKARDNAAGFSRRIPLATRAQLRDSGEAFVVTYGSLAPNAAPFEYAERHPLFAHGPRGTDGWQHWYTQPHRPYMEEASVEAADEAADAYFKVIDDWTRRLGYKP